MRTVAVTVKVEGREEIKTPAGTFQTIRVQPTADAGVVKNRGTITIWYTDDARHLPVQIRAKLFWGTLIFHLQSPRKTTKHRRALPQSSREALVSLVNLLRPEQLHAPVVGLAAERCRVAVHRLFRTKAFAGQLCALSTPFAFRYSTTEAARAPARLSLCGVVPVESV